MSSPRFQEPRDRDLEGAVTAETRRKFDQDFQEGAVWRGDTYRCPPFRMCRTVDGATVRPSFVSSPWIQR
jgi:hypothetical protein